jgi:predicted membrane-bound dolichyl-phosphate-mannose-protein mannosyltransferase
MRWITRGLICILAIYVSLVVYTNRALFFSRFDVQYWQDKFEHSQWSLPLSVRTIGDDGLYLYDGYRLIHGGNPTLYNAEVPPLGKYLIGASIGVFGNGYIYGLLTTSMLVLVFFLVCSRLTKNRMFSLAATVVLVTDPLITGQFPLTMLDSLQSLFLMLFLLVLLNTSKHHPWAYPALAGLVLGCFSETKFPIFTPFIAFVGFLYEWVTYKKVIPVLLFVASIIIGYLLPYIPYFINGHTLAAWLGVQKWIVSFYLHSKLTPTWGSALVNLLIGYYQNIFSRTWLPASHWSPTWTIATLVSVAGLYITLWKNKREWYWIATGSIVGFLLLLYQGIPFWTRYLVMLLPLLYLYTCVVFTKIPKKIAFVIFSAMITANILSSVPILFPTPEATAKQVIYNWENMFFQDMYEDMTTDRRMQISRVDYRQFALQSLADAQIESIRITQSPTSWQRFAAKQSMHVTITYFTRNLGSFIEYADVPILLEDGRWRVPWDWSMLFSDLTTTRRLVTTVYPARRGTLYGSDKKAIVEDVKNDMIWVTPKNIDRSKEDAMFKFIEGLFEGKIAAVYFHQRTHGNTLSNQVIPLGIPPLPLNPKQRMTLESFPGITLTPSYGRVNHGSDMIDVGTVANTQYFECCTRLYTTTTYDGITGAEKNKNDILKGINGGMLNLINNDGSVVRTLLQVDKKDGIDTQP